MRYDRGFTYLVVLRYKQFQQRTTYLLMTCTMVVYEKAAFTLCASSVDKPKLETTLKVLDLSEV